MKLLSPTLLTLIFFAAPPTEAQDIQPYASRTSFSAFTEYSNTSSRIILGAARSRRLVSFGFTFSQRLLHSRVVDWHYAPEILPIVFVEDPVASATLVTGGYTYSLSAPVALVCKPVAYTTPLGPGGFTFNQTCGSRWTYAGGLSPLGQRVNFAPRNRIQPFVMANAGFLVAPRDIPVNNSSRFNFTFEFGGGFEFFRSHHQSWSAEYRIHHLSNHYIGDQNPGVDNQIIKLTYSFHR
jgi:hypothetical protein